MQWVFRNLAVFESSNTVNPNNIFLASDRRISERYVNNWKAGGGGGLTVFIGTRG